MRGRAGGVPVKSRDQHKRDGTHRKDRHDRRADMEQQPAIGRAPSWLTKEEKREYNKLVKLQPKGFLRLGDEFSLATLARLHVKLIEGHCPGSGELGQLRLLWCEFGMTPSSRWRMPGPPKTSAADPFDELEKRRKAQEAA